MVSYEALRKEGLKDERVLLLEAWREFEVEALKLALPGSGKQFVDTVDAKFPRKVTTKSNTSNMESSYDLIFPDDEQNQGNFEQFLYESPYSPLLIAAGLKFLEKALAWKNAQQAPTLPTQDSVLGKRSHFDDTSETIDLDF